MAYELTEYSKKRLLFEVDNIKSNILARSGFKNSPFVIWPIYRCTLSSPEFSAYCLALVKALQTKYTVNKVDVKSQDILCLRIKYE